MATIQPLARTTEWAIPKAVGLSDILAKSAPLTDAKTSLVTRERDGYRGLTMSAPASGTPASGTPAKGTPAKGTVNGQADPGQAELREVFDDFVGQTFYSQMLSAMRKTVDKPAYFHGGHAEEVFQAQLDQTLAEGLADATAEQFTGPMFELFNLARQ